MSAGILTQLGSQSTDTESSGEIRKMQVPKTGDVAGGDIDRGECVC